MRISFVIFVFFLVSCSNIKERNLSYTNPTTFIFDYPVEKVKSIIRNNFENYNYRRMGLYFMGNDDPDSTSLFKQEGNENDFCLSTYNDPIGKSYNNFEGDRRLEYIASFHLHLEDMDHSKTKVTVFTLHPRVITGKTFFPNIHGVRSFDYKPVNPSTIEEYEILSIIGRALGQLNMPPLRKPEFETKR